MDGWNWTRHITYIGHITVKEGRIYIRIMEETDREGKGHGVCFASFHLSSFFAASSSSQTKTTSTHHHHHHKKVRQGAKGEREKGKREKISNTRK